MLELEAGCVIILMMIFIPIVTKIVMIFIPNLNVVQAGSIAIIGLSVFYLILQYFFGKDPE
jgi:hypothetical protein